MGNYPSILVHMASDYLVSDTNVHIRVPRYGWRPDVPDRRDVVLAHYPTDTDDDASTTSPPGGSADVLRVDLRKQCPAVYDDEGLACSTVSALAALLEFHELRTRPNAGYEPSRLCWYYLTREAQGTQRADAGASFRDALKVVNDEGVCDEVDWPFDATCVTVAPEWATYESTPRSRRIGYRRVPQTLEALKYCLTHELPVACGLSVYTSFESSVTRRTGQVTLPACAQDLADVPVAPPKDDDQGNASTALDADDDDAHLGGHAVVLVGYDDTEQQFIVRNSQGVSWGANGYGFVPYSYVLNSLLARDFWVVDGDAGDEAEEHATASDEVDTRGDTDDQAGDQAGDQANTDDDTVPPLFRALLDRVGA
jgi:hypothetical protein